MLVPLEPLMDVALDRHDGGPPCRKQSFFCLRF
jgi:hypothetical protein